MMNYAKAKRSVQVVESVACVVFLTMSVCTAYTTGKGIRGAIEANRALGNLKEEAPKFFDKMIVDAEQAVAAGRMTQAQFEILRQRATKQRELFNSLAQEMIAKQSELATDLTVTSTIRAAATAVSAGSGLKLYRANTGLLEKGTFFSFSAVLGGAASLSLIDAQRHVEVRDVQDSFNKLKQAWAQPEDEFALAMMTARIRPVLQAAGIDRWNELNREQQGQARQNAIAGIKSLRDKLKAEGWIPPGGDWDQFLRDEIAAYRRDASQTSSERAAEATEKYRGEGATAMTYVGWYEPTWMKQWEASHPDDEFNIQTITMQLTVDNRASIAGGELTYWPGKKAGTKNKPSYREFSFQPVWKSISVSSELVSGTVDMRCERFVDEAGREVKATMLNECSFKARKMANGNWLLEVTPGFANTPEVNIPLKYLLVPTGRDKTPNEALSRSRKWKTLPDLKEPAKNQNVIVLDEKSLKYTCGMSWAVFDLKNGSMNYKAKSEDLKTKLDFDLANGTMKGSFSGNFETEYVQHWHINYIKPFVCEGRFSGEIADGQVEKYVNAKGDTHWRFNGTATVQLDLHGGRTMEDRSSTPFKRFYAEGDKRQTIEAAIDGSTEADVLRISTSWYEKRPTMPITFILTFGPPLPKLKPTQD
jgi:hypothetical protein